MKHFALIALLALTGIIDVTAQNNAFTYQGRLNDNGGAASGTYDLRFTIHDSATNGNVVGGPRTNSAATISNGLFTVTLDFGAGVFTGAARWLEISVRTNGGGVFTTLNPRQQLTPSPYAIHASNADSASTANIAGAVAAANITGTILDAQLSPNIARTNQVWLLAGNTGTSAGTHFVGTRDDEPLHLHVNGRRAARLEPTTDVGATRSNMVNVVNGSAVNSVAVGVRGATIGGGGAGLYDGISYTNNIAADLGTIAGGAGNTLQVLSDGSSIGGGSRNRILGAYNATIAGGVDNTIQRGAWNAAIGGGQFNQIQTNALSSTIGGGFLNVITGPYGAIPGGDSNVASTNSFAAGHRAKAIHRGSFVWGDSTDQDASTTSSNQFLVRANGGVRFVTGGSGLTVDGMPLSKETAVPNDANYSNIVNVVHGSPVNFVSNGVVGATISGGGAANYVTGAYSNSVLGNFSTIGGGLNNKSGGAFGWYATVGGGANNVANGTSATVAGGYVNQATNEAAAVGGGTFNIAGGIRATVPGGQNNVAAGFTSFAAGNRAKANHDGTFVWGDSQDADVASTGNNQFLIRAAGGVGIGTTSPGAALDVRTTSVSGNALRFGYTSGGAGNLIAGPSRIGIATDSLNERISINQGSGNVGIGVLAPQTVLHVLGADGVQLRLQNSANNRYWTLYSESFNDSGNFLFVPSAGTFAYIRRTDGAFLSGSDERLKRDITPLVGVLDRVLQLRPVTYRFRDESENKTRTLGLIAQEVEPLFPEVVGEHAGMKALAYSELIPVTIGAVQELNQRMATELKAKEDRIAKLEQRLSALEKLVRLAASEEIEQ